MFTSIQGESPAAGYPCAFVRLAGCNLDCVYCDTRYARDPGSGQQVTVQEIVERMAQYRQPYVAITGGEPLTQAGTPELIIRLLDEGHKVIVETNGSQNIALIDTRARVVLDIKTPGSGMAEFNLVRNLESLRAGDSVKFVLTNREDYEFARQWACSGRIRRECEIFFSPAHGMLARQQLAEWMVADAVPVRLQLQLHRVIWPDRERGV